MSDDEKIEIHIKVWVRMRGVDSTREQVITLNRKVWGRMSPDDRQEAMQEVMSGMVTWDYEPLD
ncbi:MAG: hypothetical protein GWN00_01055 [Aliifodinibius sp.]|nr:hypothetical protein [Fodinibius sp.]NIV09919.1 hypothetical protein [Fodinibius sp.]NIY23449.1 hypothetical protein [Fodinibius sp.]